jgi:two-component system chemotaxis response regulator CheB
MIRVLIAEGSPTIRQLLADLLEKQSGIEVVAQASSGMEAIDMARRLRPDLITMDVEMPDMNGLEATRRIMISHPTPILIVTALAPAPYLSVAFDALRAGALDVVARPQGLADWFDPSWERPFLNRVRTLAGIKPPAFDVTGAVQTALTNPSDKGLGRK